MKSEIISNCLSRGLDYLASQQLPNGGFVGYSSQESGNWQNDHAYQTVFGPALILDCLNQLPDRLLDSEKPVANRVRDNLGHFLQSQQAVDGSFNYWASTESQRQIMPYPNDLDDSFCAWSSLLGWRPEQLTGSSLARIIKLLLSNEQAPGGPYRTWLVGDDSAPVWRDVDLAVNCNIARFLKMVGLTAEPLNRYLGQQIEQQNFKSTYYPSSYSVWYFLARAYAGSQRPKLKQIVGQQAEKLLDQLETTPAVKRQAESLNLALCLSALTLLQADDRLRDSLAKSLFKNQQADGSWPAAALWIDPTRQGRTYHHGSAALTTALTLEALARYQANHKHTPSSRLASADSHLEDKLSQKIFSLAEQRLSNSSEELSQPAQKILKQLKASHRQREIVLLPYLFAQSLVQPTVKPTLDKFIDLGLASLYGWMAYTIYDDFLDDAGQVRFLPAANLCHRLSLATFQQTVGPTQTAFLAYVEQVFETMDEANAWEVTHCRSTPGRPPLSLEQLPAFGDRHSLADRSLGHLLAPIGSLILCGRNLSSPAIQKLEQGLRHYLIARQLHDELHDWPDDLAAGHLSYTVCELWHDLSGRSRHQATNHQLPMRRQFWYHSLTNICDVIDFHCQQASRAIASSHLLTAGGITDQLLSQLRTSTSQTRRQQKQLVGFLEEYRHSPKPRLLTLS